MKKALTTAALLCCLGTALFAAAAFQAKAAETEATLSTQSNTAPEDHPEEETSEEAPSPEERALTLEDIRAVTFADVPQTSAQSDCISYTAYQDILSGIDSDSFRPDDWTTLAVVLTTLHRMSGEPAPACENTYTDVLEENWYVDTVAWAYQAGILADSDSGRLDAQEPVTRARLAVLLYRFAAFEDGRVYDRQLAAYTDGADVPEYAQLPLAWALENRIFSGMVFDTIHPKLPVTRAQLAQVLTALTAFQTEEPVAMALTTQLSAKIAVSASQANHEDIQVLINQTALKYGASGLQAAVVENGRLTDWYTYGWATKNSTAMTSEHKIRAASISKVAVGIAAMLLRERRYIDLDADIGTYWGIRVQNPSYPNTPITIRSLLSHTSSIRNFDSISRNYSAVKAQLSSSSCFTSKEPGVITSWDYNNYGFAVLGLTLELASNKYLDTVLDENLWKIMEIDAAFEGGCIDRKDLLTTLYYQDGAVSRTTSAQSTYVRGDKPGQKGSFFAGDLTISAKDLAKMAALLASGGYYEGLRLMAAESIEQMEARSDTILPDNTFQALPLRSQDAIYGRDRLYYHTGSAYGAYNLFSYDPDTGDGVVVLTVGASGAKDDRGIYAVCGEISSYIYEVIEEDGGTIDTVLTEKENERAGV